MPHRGSRQSGKQMEELSHFCSLPIAPLRGHFAPRAHPQLQANSLSKELVRKPVLAPITPVSRSLPATVGELQETWAMVDATMPLLCHLSLAGKVTEKWQSPCSTITPVSWSLPPIVRNETGGMVEAPLLCLHHLSPMGKVAEMCQSSCPTIAPVSWRNGEGRFATSMPSFPGGKCIREVSKPPLPQIITHHFLWWMGFQSEDASLSPRRLVSVASLHQGKAMETSQHSPL